MRRAYKLILEQHKQTDLATVLDKLQIALIELKHDNGEINGWEIRDSVKRLRSG